MYFHSICSVSKGCDTPSSSRHISARARKEGKKWPVRSARLVASGNYFSPLGSPPSAAGTEKALLVSRSLARSLLPSYTLDGAALLSTRHHVPTRQRLMKPIASIFPADDDEDDEDDDDPQQAITCHPYSAHLVKSLAWRKRW